MHYLPDDYLRITRGFYMTYARFLKPKILNALDASPIVLLMGGRQTGKTTLMKEIAQERGMDYISLDDIRYLNGARADPIGFLEQFKRPLIIDEIQRAPELALSIKQKVDEGRTSGMFALTGSSNPLVAPKLSDSLAGRMFILQLWPLSQAEIRGNQPHFLNLLFDREWVPGIYTRWGREEMIQSLLVGGYPSVHTLIPSMQEEWFNSLLRTLLERDIQDLAHIRKLEELPILMQVLADRSSSVLNMAEVARTIKMPNTTLSFYLTLLEALFLILRQPAWHKNSTKKMSKSPKAYVVDPGMMAFLIGADANRLLAQPSLLGKLLETFVVIELEKLIGWSSMRLQSYYYRTATGIEVDVILENRAGELVGIEIKSSETVRTDDFDGLRSLKEHVGSQFIRGIVLYPGADTISFGGNMYALPITSLFS